MMSNLFQCRELCGACCISPSISSPIPDMPNGKPAEIACVQLDEHFRCKLFLNSLRPAVCRNLKPCYEMRGNDRDEASQYLTKLERLTAKDN